MLASGPCPSAQCYMLLGPSFLLVPSPTKSPVRVSPSTQRSVSFPAYVCGFGSQGRVINMTHQMCCPTPGGAGGKQTGPTFLYQCHGDWAFRPLIANRPPKEITTDTALAQGLSADSTSLGLGFRRLRALLTLGEE